jgi:hypothetical protein
VDEQAACFVVGETEELVKFVIDKLRKNPQRTHEIYSLWAGEMGRDPRISNGTIDLERITKICSSNAFSTSSVPGRRRERPWDKEIGLWVLPSFFNHSCVPNCDYPIWDGYMTIRTLRDVKKGEELTLCYSLEPDCKDRWKAHKGNGFTCHCPLCDEERRDPNCKTRLAIQRKIKRLSKKEDANVVLPLVNEIRQTYSGQRVKQGLGFALRELGTRFLQAGRNKEAIDCFEEILTCNTELTRMRDLLNFVALGDLREFRPLIFQRMNEAFELFKVVYGLGAKVFKLDLDQMFPWSPRSITIPELTLDWLRLQ